MAVTLSLILFLGLLSCMVLFRKKTMVTHSDYYHTHDKVSVIIPARNEELNLPHLLDSLLAQSMRPDEIIVVDDHSEDQTKQVAESYGFTVLTAPDLPKGWTGKNWALWNGYMHSSGSILVFLDADVRLAVHAIQSLILQQQRQGGVISSVPYHQAEKFYEKLSMILNVLGVFAFTSPFEQRNHKKGLYGACIVTTREDYEAIGGHHSIQSEMLDDLNLGARFQEAGIPVENYIGDKLVSFRMYPYGIKSELEGFSKGTILSTSAIHAFTIVSIVFWIIGLIASELFPCFVGTPYFIPLFIGYILYALEFSYFNRDVGRFGMFHPVFHFLSTIFFLIVVGYSLYQSFFRKKVIWKGRYIHVGRDGK